MSYVTYSIHTGSFAASITVPDNFTGYDIARQWIAVILARLALPGVGTHNCPIQIQRDTVTV